MLSEKQSPKSQDWHNVTFLHGTDAYMKTGNTYILNNKGQLVISE